METLPVTMPRVLSMNVGGLRHVDWRGRRVTTGIWKHPVAGRVALRGVNFVGDEQADRSVHGGPDKAVYAYAREDYDFWREHEGMAERGKVSPKFANLPACGSIAIT